MKTLTPEQQQRAYDLLEEANNEINYLKESGPFDEVDPVEERISALLDEIDPERFKDMEPLFNLDGSPLSK